MAPMLELVLSVCGKKLQFIYLKKTQMSDMVTIRPSQIWMKEIKPRPQ